MSPPCEHSLPALVVGVAGLLACAGQSDANHAQAKLEPPNERRREAPGVAVDPRFELPAPRLEALAEDRFVSLAAPAGDGEVRALVRRLFHAISRESKSELRALLASDATASFPDVENQTAHVAWFRRFSTGRYSALSPSLMYREQKVEVYRAPDSATLEGRRPLRFSPTAGDIVVVIPLTSPGVGRNRLFGNEMQLLLTSNEGPLLIRASYEDLPRK